MQEQDLGLCDMNVEVDGITLQCDNAATVKIMGERDSFGCEWIHCCDGCATTLRKEIAAARDRAEAAAALKPCVSCGARGPKAQVSLCRHELQPWEDAYPACQDCQNRWYEQDMEYLYGLKCDKCSTRSHSLGPDSDGHMLCPSCYAAAEAELAEKYGRECQWCGERHKHLEQVNELDWSLDNFLELCASCAQQWHVEGISA